MKHDQVQTIVKLRIPRWKAFLMMLAPVRHGMTVTLHHAPGVRLYEGTPGQERRELVSNIETEGPGHV
jgi:hypothetical protein